MLHPLRAFRLRGWSIVLETSASLRRLLPIEPVLLGLGSTLNYTAAYQDGLQASGGGGTSVRCRGNWKTGWFSAHRGLFSSFPQRISRLRQKGWVIIQHGLGNSLWVGEHHTRHALNAPDGLMHNLCIMQGTLWGPLSGKFVRQRCFEWFSLPGKISNRLIHLHNTLKYWSTTACNAHNCQWVYVNASLFIFLVFFWGFFCTAL